jgi:hypothetical protein
MYAYLDGLLLHILTICSLRPDYERVNVYVCMCSGVCVLYVYMYVCIYIYI